MTVWYSANPAIHDDPECLSGGAPETARVPKGGAAGASWLERALDDMLALRRQDRRVG
jgi:hypothetical protein